MTELTAYDEDRSSFWPWAVTSVSESVLIRYIN